MEQEKKFLTVKDVKERLECSESFAYGIIRQLNDELKAKGYLVARGRVSAKYFNERTYEGAS